MKPDTGRVVFIELRADEIVFDEKWHGRSATGSGAPIDAAEKPGDEWSDEQLEQDIRSRGLIEPLRVRKLQDGRWGCVAGARRLAACRRIGGRKKWPCTYNDRERDDFIAASTTLAENTHRRPMRQWEIANHLWSMHAARPELDIHALAEACGMTPGLCRTLVTVRSRATPELWQLFEVYNGALPAGINWKDYAKICRLPRAEQMPAWTALVEERLKAVPTPRRKRGMFPTKERLAKHLEEVGEQPATPYQRGLRAGLLVALGEKSWSLAFRGARIAKAAKSKRARKR